MGRAEAQSIWTRAFALLCLAEFLGYAQHFVLQPTFPLYITYLGASPLTVGFVIAGFGVASVLSRPLIGYWADRWSETGVLILGLLLQALTVSLCLLPSAGMIAFANSMRGIGWSGMTTGGYTLLASSAPPARRGEASGYYGSVQSCATIIFPAVAIWIIESFPEKPSRGFYCAIILAATLALGAAAAGGVLSRHASRLRAPRQLDRSVSVWRDIVRVFDRNILLAGALLFTSHLSLPCVTSFAVIYAQEIGIGSFAWFFIVNGATSVVARPLLGRLSDRIGCVPSLVVAFTMQSLALLMLPAVSTLAGMMSCGALYFMGSAIGSARILALAMEFAPPERRGSAMASFSVAFPLSNSAGALLSGFVVQLAGYHWMYWTAAAICAGGLILTARFRRRLISLHRTRLESGCSVASKDT
jgi:MFS family permease